MSKLKVGLLCLFLLFLPHTAIAQDSIVAEVEQIFEIQSDNILDIEWSPDGERFAILDSLSILFFDTQSWELESSIPDVSTNAIEWSPDGNLIASPRGGNPRTLIIRDAITGEVTQTLARFYEEIDENALLFMYTLAWNPDSIQIVSDGGSDILLWGLETGSVVTLGSHDDNRVSGLDWSPDGTHVVSITNGWIRVWDVLTGENTFSVEARTGVDWHPTESLVLGVTVNFNNGVLIDGQAVIWDVETGEELGTFRPNAIPYAANWNYDGTLVATRNSDGTVMVWDVQTGQKILEINTGYDLITGLDWHPNQDVIAVIGVYNGVRIWRIDS